MRSRTSLIWKAICRKISLQNHYIFFNLVGLFFRQIFLWYILMILFIHTIDRKNHFYINYGIFPFFNSILTNGIFLPVKQKISFSCSFSHLKMFQSIRVVRDNRPNKLTIFHVCTITTGFDTLFQCTLADFTKVVTKYRLDSLHTTALTIDILR